jgi:hypothetical protein
MAGVILIIVLSKCIFKPLINVRVLPVNQLGLDPNKVSMWRVYMVGMDFATHFQAQICTATANTKPGPTTPSNP